MFVTCGVSSNRDDEIKNSGNQRNTTKDISMWVVLLAGSARREAAIALCDDPFRLGRAVNQWNSFKRPSWQLMSEISTGGSFHMKVRSMNLNKNTTFILVCYDIILPHAVWDSNVQTSMEMSHKVRQMLFRKIKR